MSRKTVAFLIGVLVWVVLSLITEYVFFRDVPQNTYIWIFMAGAIVEGIVRSVRETILEME